MECFPIYQRHTSLKEATRCKMQIDSTDSNSQTIFKKSKFIDTTYSFLSLSMPLLEPRTHVNVKGDKSTNMLEIQEGRAMKKNTHVVCIALLSTNSLSWLINSNHLSNEETGQDIYGWYVFVEDYPCTLRKRKFIDIETW